jgi:anaerobic selenocysteine-containing dehydrogenase
MPTTPTTCPLDCPDACGIVVTSDDDGRFVSLRGNPDHGYNHGALCGKTAIYGDMVQSPERLTTPLVRAGGELRPSTWDEAIALIAGRVNGLPGERILAASYAGSMGIVARRFPERMMHALGAVFTDGGLCDNSATVGYETVYGRVYGVDIERADESDLFVLWGCDMKRTVQHLQPAVQRRCKQGVPAVAIDVYRTDTIRALESWGGGGIQVRPGTDAMLALALCRLAYERGQADLEFLARECHGHEEFEQHVRRGHDLDTASRVTGVPTAEIERLFELLTASRRPLLKVGVGFARRRNGAMSMRAVCSLAAVLGRADRVHYESFDCFGLAQDVIEGAQLRPETAPTAPIRHVELGRELQSGRFGALFVWGHNPAVTCPDSGRVRAGLASPEVFTVVHDHFVTESAALADVVLPATMFVEHTDVYRSYGHRRLHYSRAASRAPDGPRNNVDTFAAIARALELPPETWDVTDESLCEELLEASQARFAPGQLDQLRAGEAVKLEPAGERGTPSGKIELLSEAAEAVGQPGLATFVPDDGCGASGAFWLHCTPSVHTHNSTYSHSARHVKRVGTPHAWMNPADAAEAGLAEGDMATLFNRLGEVSFPIATTDDLPTGVVRVDGLPRGADTPEGVGINQLVSSAVSDLGESNTLYSTRVDVRARPRSNGGN